MAGWKKRVAFETICCDQLHQYAEAMLLLLLLLLFLYLFLFKIPTFMFSLLVITF